MTQEEQIDHLENDIDALINRYKDEFDLTHPTLIGVLQMKCHLLMYEAVCAYDNEDGDNEDYSPS